MCKLALTNSQGAALVLSPKIAEILRARRQTLFQLALHDPAMRASKIQTVRFTDRTARIVATLLTIVCVSASTGCITFNKQNLQRFASVIDYGTPSMVAIRKTGRDRLHQRLTWFTSSAPEPNSRTKRTLIRYGLDEQARREPQVVLARLSQSIHVEPTLDKLFAFSDLAGLYAHKAVAAGDEKAAMDLFGVAVVHSYMFLLDERFDRERNTYDPVFHEARRIYNSSLEGMLRIIASRGELRPGKTHSVYTAGRKFDIACVSRGPWANDEFERFEFVSDYKMTGLRNRHQTFGLGVPLIAVRRKQASNGPIERYYPNGLSFPVTAFLRVCSSRRSAANSSDDTVELCSLELYDPLTTRDVKVDGRVARLESDLSTPLAFYLNDPLVRTPAVATFALLDANFGKQLRGLYMLEPYQSNKIPVVMVHGLWSSPTTWMEMFNDLRADPAIHDRYQFWFYLYPSGQPFWVSASDMRDDLAQARRTLDPTGRSPAINEMVLVGHSMGGLISKLQTLESGQDFWRILSDQPFDRLNANHATREQLARSLFFRPDPSVRRVITIATPHRGSQFANSTTQWLSRSLFTIPEMLTFGSEKLLRENTNFFRDTKLLQARTSVESLDPDCPMFPAMLAARKSSWVKYHNVVGTAGPSNSVARIGTKITGEGDGVVELASAHLEDVDSELVVEAHHMSAHQNPHSILEVRRILLEHLRDIETSQ